MAKIFIGIPSYDGKIDMNIMSVFAQMLGEYSGQHTFGIDFFAGSSVNIGTARNQIVKNFLGTDFDYLYFWDADVALTNVGFLRSLLFAGRSLDAAIVGGCYLIKDEKGEYACGMKDNSSIRNFKIGELTKPQEVDVLGTGSMLISRAVFEKMADPWFETKDLANGQFMPEDYTFCLKAKNLGFKVAVDPRFETQHFGWRAYIHKP